MGEVNARLKQLEVALDAAQTDKQKAESEATLAKEKIEALKLETQQNELLVRFCPLFFQDNLLVFICEMRNNQKKKKKKKKKKNPA